MFQPGIGLSGRIDAMIDKDFAAECISRKINAGILVKQRDDLTNGLTGKSTIFGISFLQIDGRFINRLWAKRTGSYIAKNPASGANGKIYHYSLKASKMRFAKNLGTIFQMFKRRFEVEDVCVFDDFY